MHAAALDISPPEFWRLTFWEIGAIAAARIDGASEDLKPLDSLFDQTGEAA